MSTAVRKLNYAVLGTYTVTAGQAATLGEGVIFGPTDEEVQDAAAASDVIIGVAKTTEVAGARVEVFLFGPVVPVVVGTGDATRGTKAIAAANGWTDAAAHDSDGTGNASAYGVFMQSGVAGDIVGMMLGFDSRGV